MTLHLDATYETNWYLAVLHTADGRAFGVEYLIMNGNKAHNCTSPRPPGAFVGVLVDVEGAGYMQETVVTPALDWNESPFRYSPGEPLGSLESNSSNWKEELLVIQAKNFTVELELSVLGERPLVAMGERGVDWTPLWATGMTHLDLPFVSAKGRVAVGEEVFDVSGGLYITHQWGAHLFTDASSWSGWDWFGIVLSDGWALQLGFLGRAEVRKYSYMNIVEPDGTTRLYFIDDYSMTQSEPWTSPRTGHTYHTQHTIKVPIEDVELHVTTLVQDNEVELLRLYEAPSKVVGTHNGKPVTGFGFTEHVPTTH